MDLAERGSNLNLDITTENIMQKTADAKDDDDLYGSATKLAPRPLFLWGHGFQKDLCKIAISTRISYNVYEMWWHLELLYKLILGKLFFTVQNVL